MSGALVLAIDTAGADSGLALSGGGRVDVVRLGAGANGRARTEGLAEATAGLLAARGKRPSDLTLVAAVVGPGSYTGLRSGLAFLRGLAFPDSLPAVAVGALEVLAWGAGEPGETVAVALAVAKDRCAIGVYRREANSVEEQAAPVLAPEADYVAVLKELEATALIVAPAQQREEASAPPARQDEPSAIERAAQEAGLPLRVAKADGLEQLASLVEARAAAGRTVKAEEVLPIYVGQSATLPNRGRIVVPSPHE